MAGQREPLVVVGARGRGVGTLSGSMPIRAGLVEFRRWIDAVQWEFFSSMASAMAPPVSREPISEIAKAAP